MNGNAEKVTGRFDTKSFSIPTNSGKMVQKFRSLKSLIFFFTLIMHTSIVRRKQKKEQFQAFGISVSQKCLNHYSVHCLSLKNILIFKEAGTKLKQFEKSPSEWSGFPKLSCFSKEGHKRWGRIPSCSFVHVRQNSSEYLRNVLGDLQILSEPYEKSWHSQHKNATPIN